MTGSATGFFSRARWLVSLSVVIAVPLAAQDQAEPVLNEEPGVRDVAMTPLRDLNLAKDPIPEILLAAAQAPYASDGLRRCRNISEAIAQLDAVLGPDMDVMESDDQRISVGRIATRAVGSLMPFRGIVRELTGAADHERQFEQAIYAGSVRRGFLKGLGQQRGCAYPARPAFASVKVTKADRVGTDKATKTIESKDKRGADGTVFVSQPVVQPTGG